MKKMVAMLLALCLAAGCVPAYARQEQARPAIQFVNSENPTGGVNGWSQKNDYDYIYFGNWAASGTPNPLKWRVLDTKTNTGEKGLFLLSDSVLGAPNYGGAVAFEISYTKDTHEKSKTNSAPANAWQGSDAQKWCMDFAGLNPKKLYYSGEGYMAVPTAFAEKELAAILETNKSDDQYKCWDAELTFLERANILNGDRVFFLSAQEADNQAYGFNSYSSRLVDGQEKDWWLRSAGIAKDESQNVNLLAGLVHGKNSTPNAGDAGSIDQNTVDDTNAARPAFNLNLDSVLLVSAAQGGKNSSAGRLSSIPSASTSEWKLTILDEDREAFAANMAGSSDVAQGQRIRIQYSEAAVGSNEYISAILTDAEGNALYYGRLASVNSSSGTLAMHLPSDLEMGDYTLKVFNEQYHGDYQTDYASPFSEISLTVQAAAQDNGSQGGVENAGDAPQVNLLQEEKSETEVPQTGDDSAPLLWAALCMAGCVGACILIMYARKKKTES